ncbi:hypothetical protein BS78_08G068800 [Paspalum vaginatum]|nr:hypothetical protein BS78_08G068800 [Paspalum vaginatum]
MAERRGLLGAAGRVGGEGAGTGGGLAGGKQSAGEKTERGRCGARGRAVEAERRAGDAPADAAGDEELLGGAHRHTTTLRPAAAAHAELADNAAVAVDGSGGVRSCRGVGGRGRGADGARHSSPAWSSPCI